ncbi:hypothetical protein B0H14DRAFT_2838916 [Mycena olivaceomarginata]|nr:hypothetical protein B0H14DRAFT_2838916 [Mycena olivaceomarginata]
MTLKSGLDDFSRYRNAYLLAVSVALGSLFYGYDVGLIGGVLSLDSFQHYFGLDKMTPSEKAWLNGNIVAILQLGCLLGAVGVGSFSSRYGRKPCLLASGAIYVVGSALQVVVGLGSTREYALSLLYAGRFLGGIGVGMVTALVPSYVSECTPQAIRGRCTGFIQLAINTGILLSFWVNYFASKNLPSGESQWRIPFAIQEQYDRAARTLAYLNRTAVDDLFILETIEEIKTDFVGKRQLSTLQQIRRMGESQGIALRCFIPSLVMFFQQWTGTNAINYFSPAIFASLGIDGTTAELFATGVYGGVKVISVGLTLVIAVEGVGRKKCLIVGGLGQSVMMLWIGVYRALHPAPNTGGPYSSIVLQYISIVAVYFYAVFYSIGWGPIPWVVAAEVAPNHLRTAVISTATGVNWLFSLTISKLTPIMLNDLGYGTFSRTAGFGLEEIGLLFETDVILRALQDAPGGRIFIGGRRAAPVVKLSSVAGGVEDSEAAALLGPDSD